MNEHDTADVVKRIVGTWPMAPKGYLWTEAIGELDYRLALAAYTQLRDEIDTQHITIARYLAAYRSIDRRGNTKRQHDLAGTRCELCEGDGMVTVWERVGAYEYSAQAPCECPLGDAARRTLARVIEFNDAELTRTNPHRERTYTRLSGPPLPGPIQMEIDS